MGDDTAVPSSIYPGGSEDDFNALRAEIAQLKADKAQLEKNLAWCSGEGHAVCCPQCYDDCNCGYRDGKPTEKP